MISDIEICGYKKIWVRILLVLFWENPRDSQLYTPEYIKGKVGKRFRKIYSDREIAEALSELTSYHLPFVYKVVRNGQSLYSGKVLAGRIVAHIRENAHKNQKFREFLEPSTSPNI